MAPVLIFVLPNVDFRKGTSFLKKLALLDWFGMALFYASTACIILAMNFGGTTYDWQSGGEIALWIVGGVTFAAFLLSQWFMPFTTLDNRIYPAHFMRFPHLLNLQTQLALGSGILYVSILCHEQVQIRG